jgi:hypothetical protein
MRRTGGLTAQCPERSGRVCQKAGDAQTAVPPESGPAPDTPASPGEPRIKKAWTLTLIQTAWVVEAAVLIGYTLCMIPLLSPERLSLWLTALPVLSGVIAGQGAAAGIGPLVSKHIQNKGGGYDDSMGPAVPDGTGAV